MASLEVLSPVANVVEQSVKPAPRLRDLGHATAHPELGWLADHPDLPLPVVEAPDCFEIAVGGAAGRGAYFYGAGEPVTMPVED